MSGAARPDGVASGGFGLVVAWLGGLVIAQLTGATPVVIMLVAATVLAAIALLSGRLALEPVAVGAPRLPASSTAGESFPVSLAIAARRPVWVNLRHCDAVVASGWAQRELVTTACMPRRGVVDSLVIEVRSAGALGLVWWRRRMTLAIPTHVVAPPLVGGGTAVRRDLEDRQGDATGALGAIAGETDGVRPWRDGDSEKFVHWTTTLRTGELIVHDRRHDASLRWVVRARYGAPDPDAEAGVARWALEQGLRSGAAVFAAVGDAEPVAIPDGGAAGRWAARADLGPQPAEPRRRSLRRMSLGQPEPESTARRATRWWAAATTIVALTMMTGALGYGIVTSAVTVAAIVAGAALTAGPLATGRPAGRVARAIVAIGALVGVVAVAASVSGVTGLLGLLQGPLPRLLIVLVALHGLESRDCRTVRVGLGIATVVLMYAAGFRIDGTVGWWLLAWALCFLVTTVQLARPTAELRGEVAAAAPARRVTAVVATGAVAIAAIAALLAVIPVPDGPAPLTLPTLIRDPSPVPAPGAIAGPDGTVRDGSTPSDGARAPAGQAGGYTGFAQSMDTSVRGALSDQIVMRVRAPEPDFWRGQTFASFDGRSWLADSEQGQLRDGPSIDIPRTFTDVRVVGDVPVERFVQTYYAAQDLPNVVFAAYRPSQVIVDAGVWVRPDGALRASTIFTEGSVYTVVSERARVSEELLRRQGLIGERLLPRGREMLVRYLEIPASTTPETRALADRLAAGHSSTYDVVRAYEAWLSANVAYDLDAPLPDDGEDAVHDFLFDSRRGFCEQIASALTVMLRTQGVPARLATGYVSGERDAIAGVYEVRASDAHAWVEVWFPETGWQVFDPTASVPLSADAQRGSVGGGVLRAVVGGIAAHLREVIALVAGVALAAAAVRALAGLRSRRRRGRWGVVQDRFTEIAARRGARPALSNTARAAAWSDADARALADLLAGRLDQVAFDPAFDAGDDDAYRDARELLATLARR